MDNRPEYAAELRQRAEETAADRADQLPESIAALSLDETRHLLHELRVHQVELELQNEELQRAQLELQTSRADYSDLYDLAPVGYVTLSKQGLILQANLTAATLLGMPRHQLVKQWLSRFIVSEDGDTYHRHRKQLLDTGEPQACDLRMVKVDGLPFWAHLQATVAQDGKTNEPACYVVISDITDRKRAEEALTASEDKFRAIADYTANWEVWLGTDGKMLWTNPAVESITGYSSADVLAMPDFIATMVAAEDRDLVALTIQDALRGSTDNDVEFRFIRKNGSKFWLAVSWQSIFDGKGNSLGIRASGGDVTERKQAEEALRRSETQLRAILESTADGILAVDNQGKMLRVSQRFADLWRIPQPLLERRDDRALLDFVLNQLSDPDAFIKKVRTLYDSDAEDIDTITFQDGRFFERYSIPMVMDGIRTGRVWSFRDITERKRAEGALRESRERLAQLAEQSATIVWEVDAQGLYTHVSRVSEAVLGYRPDELVGHLHFYDLHPESGCEAYKTSVFAVFERKESFQNFVNAAETKAGQQVWLSTNGIPLLNADGTLRGYRGSDTDITERKRAETELQETNRQLEAATARANEMTVQAELATRAKSEFLAHMSHEIRTPMTAILGYADLLMEEHVDHASQTHVAVIKRSGEQLLGLINDILDISKVEAGKLQIEPIRCSPRELVAEVVSFMRVRATEKQLPLQTELADPLPATILTDPLRLRQVLINLLGNAIKFTDHGEIRLTVRLTSDGGPPRLRFDVTDTGIGMNAEQVGQLFRPFTQVDSSASRKFSGTGLGLCISKHLAKALGGDLEVRSHPGQGSTFSVTIDPGPLAGIRLLSEGGEAALQPPARTAAAAASQVVLHGRILLAEDSLDSQRLLALLLKRAGAEVTVVDNGQLAVAAAWAAHEAGRPFDVILMDMSMPVLDGFKATRQLRQQGYTAPIVALTAYAMTEDFQRCLAAGCNDYATKPIDRQRLLATVAPWTTRGQTPDEAPAT
ncbi:MAG: PAS domain S-box protein [Planctomycetota bacterium]|nr:PAS domain S-box protein [Planctomycetota bacterium]